MRSTGTTGLPRSSACATAPTNSFTGSVGTRSPRRRSAREGQLRGEARAQLVVDEAVDACAEPAHERIDQRPALTVDEDALPPHAAQAEARRRRRSDGERDRDQERRDEIRDERDRLEW